MLSPASILLTICILLTLSCGHIHHECTHNHHIKDINLRETRQNYIDHPYDKSIKSTRRRQLILSSTNTSPIRIRPYFDPDTISISNGLTIDQINYIQQLISVSIQYYQQFINVIPIEGALQLQRQCRSYIPTDYGNACLSYYSQDKCGTVNIPKDHFGPQLSYTYTAGNQTAYFDTSNSGNGIADTDLILYVSYGNSGSCGGSTLAYASSCYYDQYNRPIAGNINFCPYMFNNDNGIETWRSDALTTLHEMTHIIVMSSSLFDKFIDPLTGNTRENVIEFINGQKYIITPKIKEYAQEFFGCTDDSILPGLPLEDNGGSGSAGSHWEEKYTQSDYMGATVYSSQTYVSKATLILMEDSGWYYISDYKYADPFHWGQDEGCDFFENECIENNSGDSNWPQYFCSSTMDNGCTFDHASPASCQQLSNSNYCPIRQPTSHWSYPDYEGECKDHRGNDIENEGFFDSVTYGLESRCVDIKQSTSGYADGKCFRHICYGYDSDIKQWEGVYIQFAVDEEIDCHRDEAYTSKDSLFYASNSITITCPDVDTICGSSSKPFECEYGNYNDDENKCLCHVGYIGDQCDEQDRSNIDTISIATISSVAVTPVYDPGMMDIEPTLDSDRYTLCISDMSRWYWYLEGEYEYYKMHNFYPLYKSKFEQNGDYYYILWNIIDRKWIIKSIIGAASYVTQCKTDNEWNKDIETCSGNFNDAGTVTYGACQQSARIRIETQDDNDMMIENENENEVDVETKTNPYYIGEYAALIVIGLLIVIIGCICSVFIVIHRKTLKGDVNQELIESVDKSMDNDILNEIDIKDENEEEIEEIQETKINLETEMNINLR